MKNKLLSILLSVFIAFGMWIYVVTVVDYVSEATYHNIPVVLEGESVLQERGLMITSGQNNFATLVVSGKRSDLIKLKNSDITLKADLSKIYDPGEVQIVYTPSFPGEFASNAFVIESKNPDHFTMTVENRRKAEIPVKVMCSGAVPEGYISDTEEVVLDHPTIQISGPESVVQQIAYARIDVNLDGQVESISRNYRYTLCNQAGEPVDVEHITTNVGEVRMDMKIQRYKEIALAVDVVYGGGATQSATRIKIDPGFIKVSGSDALLDDLDKIVLGTIDLTDITKDEQKTFTVRLPEGITNRSGVSEVTVDISFDGLSMKEFNITNIQAINVPTGMTCELLTQAMKVTLRGPTELINQLREDDIVVTVDFAGKEVGTSQMKAAVSVNGAEYSDIGAVGTYSVAATLRAGKG